MSQCVRHDCLNTADFESSFCEHHKPTSMSRDEFINEMFDNQIMVIAHLMALIGTAFPHLSGEIGTAFHTWNNNTIALKAEYEKCNPDGL